MTGPIPGETWTLCGDPGYVYRGVGRDVIGEQYLIFTDTEGRYHIFSKDEFYTTDFTKLRETDDKAEAAKQEPVDPAAQA